MRKGQQTILLASVAAVVFMIFIGSSLLLISTGKRAASEFRASSSSYIISSVINRLAETGKEGGVVRKLNGRYDISAKNNVIAISGRNGVEKYSSVYASVGNWEIRDTLFLPLSLLHGRVVLGYAKEPRKAMADASAEEIQYTGSDSLLMTVNSSKWDSMSYRDTKTQQSLDAFSAGFQLMAIVDGETVMPEDIVPYLSYVKYWIVNGTHAYENGFSNEVKRRNDNSVAFVGMDNYTDFASYVSEYSNPDGIWFMVDHELTEEERNNITEILENFEGPVGYLIIPNGDVESIGESIHSLPCRRGFVAVYNRSYDGLKEWWKSFSACGQAYLHIDPWPFHWNPYVACDFEEKQKWRCEKAGGDAMSTPLCDQTQPYSQCVPEVIEGGEKYGNPAMYDAKRCIKDSVPKDSSRGGYFCAGWPDCEPSCMYEGRTGNVTERYGKGSYERLWGEAYGAVWPEWKFDPMEHVWINITIESPAGTILQTNMQRGEYRKACFPPISSTRYAESYPPIGCIRLNSSHMGKPVSIKLDFVYPGNWQRDWERKKGIRPFTGIETVFIPQPGKQYVLDIDGKVKEIDEMPEWIRKRLNNIKCSPGIESDNAYEGDCRFTPVDIDVGDSNSWPYRAEMKDIGSFVTPRYGEPTATSPTSEGSAGRIDTTQPIPSLIERYVDSYNRHVATLISAVREEGLSTILGEKEAVSALAAIITQESGWNEDVGCNSFDDCGLTQINIRSTASSCSDIIESSSLYDSSFSFEENARNVLSRDADAAIKCGARVLMNKISYLSARGIAQGNPGEMFKMALAAYNGGGGTVVGSVECYAGKTGKQIGEVTWEDIVEDMENNKESSCIAQTLRRYRVCISHPERINYCMEGGTPVDGCLCKGLIMKTYVDRAVPYYEAWLNAPREESGGGGGERRENANTNNGYSSINSDEICIHTIRFDTGLDNAIMFLEDIGAKWMKDLVIWSDIEPSEGERRWNDYDELYDKLSSKGIKLIPRMASAPYWSKRENCKEWGAMPSESHFGDFARFVADFIQRYESKNAWSGYIEIWNEPNYINEAYCDHVEPDKFAKMLKAVHDELERRGIRNRVKIIMGGLGPTSSNNGYMDEFDFLSQLYNSDRNVGNYYDILGYHPYGQWNDYRCKCGGPNDANLKCNIVEENGKDCWAFDRVRKVYEHLKSLGDEKKIMITEFSWRESEFESSHNLQKNDVDVRTWQMENLVRAYSNMFNDYTFLEKPACYWVMSSNPMWEKTGDLLDKGNPHSKPQKPLYYCLKNLLGNCDDESLSKAPLCPCNKNNNQGSGFDFQEKEIVINGNRFKLLDVSNGLVDVEMIPELGGRIWQIRKNGKTYLFNNKNYKRVPNWGINRCSNGNWLPVGGIELSFPDSEHGCIYEDRFSYETQENGNSFIVHMYDDNINKGIDRNGNAFRIDEFVILDKNSDRIKVKIDIENKGSDSPIQFWINAMARLSTSDPLEGYRISVPCQSIEIHSTSDARICQNPSSNNYCKNLVLTWPVYNGIDMSLYNNQMPDGWIGWFGKQCTSPRIRISDMSSSLEISGISGFESQKFFGPGKIQSSTYSYDTETYVELWLGATKNFDEDLEMRRGEKKTFEFEISEE